MRCTAQSHVHVMYKLYCDDVTLLHEKLLDLFRSYMNNCMCPCVSSCM